MMKVLIYKSRLMKMGKWVMKQKTVRNYHEKIYWHNMQICV